jgi:hypothetical protein
MPIGTNENVFRFEITIDDTSCVKAFHSFDYFCGIEPGAITT